MTKREQQQTAKNIIRILGMFILGIVGYHFLDFWGSLLAVGWFWART